ncbi:MAG: hypothetical protein KGN84_19690, partial [Acidobacteriota bacterium]|nr:hypothetical protein [Acidobacteriota bacterium]
MLGALLARPGLCLHFYPRGASAERSDGLVRVREAERKRREKLPTQQEENKRTDTTEGIAAHCTFLS